MADEWDEFDDQDGSQNDSNDDTNNDNDEFDVEKLSPSERKRYEKMRKEIEDSIVEVLAKGDQNTGVYKGLQKVLANRDKETAAQRAEIQRLKAMLESTSDKTSDVDFALDTILDMLDEDGKRAFLARRDQHNSKKAATKNEALLKAILDERTNPQPQQNWYPYGQEQETPELEQYRKEADTKLRNFVKRMGVDPNSRDLDYGDIREPLLTRMGKLEASIERLADEKDKQTIDSVREKPGTRVSTRTNTTAPRGKETDGASLLERAFATQVEKMRNASKK